MTPPPPPPEPPLSELPVYREQIQFSLRTLLVLSTVVAITAVAFRWVAGVPGGREAAIVTLFGIFVTVAGLSSFTHVRPSRSSKMLLALYFMMGGLWAPWFGGLYVLGLVLGAAAWLWGLPLLSRMLAWSGVKKITVQVDPEPESATRRRHDW